MAWYYYICIHGPGHQSTSEGFFEYPDDYSAADIKIEMENMADEWDDAIIHWWKIDKISREILDQRIKTSRSSIKYYQEEILRLKEQIARLKDTVSDDAVSVKGSDESIQKALCRAVGTSVMKNLHRAGVIIKHSELYNWKTGRTKPNNRLRTKALNAIRRAKKYPEYFMNGKRKAKK